MLHDKKAWEFTLHTGSHFAHNPLLLFEYLTLWARKREWVITDRLFKSRSEFSIKEGTIQRTGQPYSYAQYKDAIKLNKTLPALIAVQPCTNITLWLPSGQVFSSIQHSTEVSLKLKPSATHSSCVSSVWDIWLCTEFTILNFNNISFPFFILQATGL